MTLLDECVEALGRECRILDVNATNILFGEFNNKFSITFYGRIDWSKSKVLKQGMYSNKLIEDIRNTLEIKDEDVVVLWDEASLPAIESNAEKVLEVIDDITAVSFDTWIYFKRGIVIEFCHDGSVCMGMSVL